ncbi:HisA/HisF-related TIM barrel protein [Streptomyces sp. L7]
MNLGTAAHGEPRSGSPRSSPRHGDKIAVGLDVRARPCADAAGPATAATSTRRWTASTPRSCARCVVTDIAKDGTLQGPNLELLRNVCAATDRPVVASGGVSSLDDLRAISELVPLGVEGSIVGKALYAKAFTLEEALEAVAR